MTIGYAEQRGTLIYIYDQDGKQITSVSAPGRWPGDGLKDYTASTIQVQKGTLMYTYDEQGHPAARPYVVRPQQHKGHLPPSKTAEPLFICP